MNHSRATSWRVEKHSSAQWLTLALSQSLTPTVNKHIDAPWHGMAWGNTNPMPYALCQKILYIPKDFLKLAVIHAS